MLGPITGINWNFTRKRCGDLVAFVSYGAEIDNADSLKESYFVTLGQFEGESIRDLLQRKFNTLDEAIQVINEDYPQFEIEDQSKSTAEGCGSCQAH